ncbi:hydroxypyruvate isomerase [Herbaspirillum rubrisubalbicans]|uniref:TIM barrel protein n=1 Tax=Herbaspirillum rubrisubalbicans TaxID=80842 RepID=UPI00209F74E7|nr:TIM barrel protein [Herbaspirillum rubrisubalbicans]MCP1576178.1 hydroxypyruvate isomerase [Herbaspirillum rubrisubalbicans]
MDIPPLVPAANISLLFREHAFLDRFQSARRAGFSGVEFLYQEEICLPSIRRALQEYGLKHVLANMQGSQDDKGLAAVAGRELEFRERFDRSLAAACQTQAQMLHVTAGIVQHHDMPEAREVFHRNMEWAGKVAAKAGIVIVIEAINQIDVPGYFLRSLEDAIGWCSLLDTHNVALLLDLYHAGRQRLPPQALIENALPWTRHLQIAGPAQPQRADHGQDDHSDFAGIGTGWLSRLVGRGIPSARIHRRWPGMVIRATNGLRPLSSVAPSKP